MITTRGAVSDLSLSVTRKLTTDKPLLLSQRGDRPAQVISADARAILSLDDAATEQSFSQHTNEELAEFAADIDPEQNINSGLSADERVDLFNHLARSLSPETRARFSVQLSQGLNTEFNDRVSRFLDDGALHGSSNFEELDGEHLKSYSFTHPQIEGSAGYSDKRAGDKSSEWAQPLSAQSFSPALFTGPINADTTAQQALGFLKDKPATITDGGISITSARNSGAQPMSVLLQMGKNINVLMHAGKTYLCTADGDLRRVAAGHKLPLGYAHYSSVTGEPLGQPITISVDEQTGALSIDPAFHKLIDGVPFQDNWQNGGGRMEYLLIPESHQLIARTSSGPTPGLKELYRYELGSGQQFKIDVPWSVRTEPTDSQDILAQLPVLYERNLVLANGLAGNLTDEGRQRLASAMTNVNADALRVSEGALTWTDLVATIQHTNEEFLAAGIGPLLHRYGNGDVLVSVKTFQKIDGEVEVRWHNRRLAATDEATTLRSASSMFQSFKTTSTGYDLAYLEAHESHLLEAASADLRKSVFQNATPMNFGALAADGSQSNIDYLITRQPELVEESELADGNFKLLRNYAARELELAAQVLGVSWSEDIEYKGIDGGKYKIAAMRDDIRTLYRHLQADDLIDLGFSTTEQVRDNQDDSVRTVDLGSNGNFGEHKLAQARAYLNSNLEQRLEFMGIAPDTWTTVEPMIVRALVAEGDAKVIKKAEFGSDDLIKGVIGGGFIAAGFMFPPAAFGSSFLGTLAASGMQAGLGSFGMTLATTGNIRAAMRVGGESLITGAITGLAGSLTGKTRVVAEAFASGVASELQGRDFEEGVMSSVLSQFGSKLGGDLESKLSSMAPEFVADLGGKILEEAVVNGGEIPNIDDLIEAFIISYAEGAVESRLTDVFGPQSAGHYAEIFIGAGHAVIDGGSHALSNYVQSDQFMNALGNGISADVVTHFGGEESFRAQMLGDVAQVVIQANGDSDKLTQGLMSMGQTMLSRYAGERVRIQLSSDTEQPSELVDSLATLLEVGVASGFDQSTMRGYAFGPLLETLAGSAAEGLFGAAVDGDSPSMATFLRDAIPRLAQSYERHDGDMVGIGQDMSLFLGEQLARGSAANDPIQDAQESSGEDAGNSDEADDVEGVRESEQANPGFSTGSMHNEATQALIRSMLDGAPEGWEPDSSNVQVASFGSWFIGDKVDKDLAHFSQQLLNPDVRLDHVLDPRNADEYAITVQKKIQSYELSRLEPLFKDMAKGMDPKHLRMVFEELDEPYQDTLVQAISNYGSQEIKQEFVDQVQRNLIQESATGFASLTSKQQTLLLDSGQIALDIVGIFDPTGIADGANAGISLLRGDLFGAFISAVSIVPVIGDLAKLGKLGTTAETISKVADEFAGLTRTQMQNNALYKSIKPVFETISNTIDKAQNGAGKVIWERLDSEHQQTLLAMKQKMDDVLNFRTGPVRVPDTVMPSNQASLEQAQWSSTRITKELGLRLRQRTAVDKVDNWVAAEPGRTVDDYFKNVYLGGGSSKAELAKGAYGEMKSDLYFTEVKGYVPVATSHPRVDSLESGHGHSGIDGLYQKPDGEYVVVEVKANNGVTSKTEDGVRQMSVDWIMERLPEELRDDRAMLLKLLESDRLLVNYASAGSGELYSRKLNKRGVATTSGIRL